MTWWENYPVVEGQSEEWWGQFPEAEAVEEPRPGALDFLNRGIASALGGPVDLFNAAISPATRALGIYNESPVLGSDFFGDVFGLVGAQPAPPDAQAEGLLERAAEGAGMAAGFLIPGAGAVGTASRLGGPVAQRSVAVGAASRPGSSVTQRVADTIARPFTTTPIRATATEVAAGAGAGAGGHIASEAYPESPTAEIVGEVLGGLTPAGVGPALRGTAATLNRLPVTGALMSVLRGFRAGVAPFTERGAMDVARDWMTSVVEDPAMARQRLWEDSIGDLSNAARTADPGAVRVEQMVRARNPQISGEMASRHQASSERLASAAGALGGSPRDARSYLHGRQQNVIDALTERQAAAARDAEAASARINPGMDREAASVQLRQELEAAANSARASERELWDAVPLDVKVPTTGAKETYKQIRKDLARAKRDNMPAEASQFLSGKGADVEDEVQRLAGPLLGDPRDAPAPSAGRSRGFKDRESAHEVHGLYSELRRVARNARAGDTPNHDTARIADQIADALLDDMMSSATVGGPLDAALAATREYYETYGRGNVGRVLGTSRTGADRTPDELTLSTTIGRSDLPGGVASDEVLAALGSDPSDDARAALDAYLRAQFLRDAAPHGMVSPTRGQSFMRQREPTLERFPETRDTISEVLSDTERAQRVSDTAAARKQRIEKDSSARGIIEAASGSEFKSIVRGREPAKVAAELAKQAARDKTGAATHGLRGTVVQDFLSTAQVGAEREGIALRYSGAKMRSWLADKRNMAAAEEIMTPDRIWRMKRIAEEMSRLDAARSTSGSAGTLLGDGGDTMLSFAVGTMASRAGARLGAGVSGASLRTSSMAARTADRLMRRLRTNRAEELITKAVTDDRDLFDALLTPVDKLTEKQGLRIIEALSGTGAGALADDRSDDDGN